MFELLQASETKLALLVALAAVTLAARAVHRRRTLRPPAETSFPPPELPTTLRQRPLRCNECGRRRGDEEEDGWIWTRRYALCPACLERLYQDGR